MASPRPEEEQLEKVLVRHERPYYQSGGGVPKTLHPVTVPLIACLIAVGCAGGLWYAYRAFHGAISSGGQPPLIRADQAATKVKPDAAANSAAPDSDKDVYNIGQAAPTTEKLLPPPEQPLAKPVPSVVPPPPAVNPAPPSTTLQPAQVAHVPAAAAPSPSSVTQPMPTPEAAPAPQTMPTKPVTPQLATSPPPAAATAAPAKTDKPAPGESGFRLQVAATKDEGAAQSEWARLRKAHADLLGNLSLTVVRADLGEKGVFYRLQAGVIPDRADAEKLCAQLRAVSIGCILVKAQ